MMTSNNDKLGVLSLTDEFGPGTGAIWLGDLHCDGTEGSLLDCPRVEFHSNSWNYLFNPCQHNQDVGVKCRPHTQPG